MQFEYEAQDTPEDAKPEKHPGGRPKGSTILQPTEETFKNINGLARIHCTQKEAAAVLGVHLNTFRSFLEAHEKAREAWEDGPEQGRASLRRQQFKAAETGNVTMQIWLGKQWLGQKDQTENRTTLVSEATDEFLDARAAHLLGKAGIDNGFGGDGEAEVEAEVVCDLSEDGAATSGAVR